MAEDERDHRGTHPHAMPPPVRSLWSGIGTTRPTPERAPLGADAPADVQPYTGPGPGAANIARVYDHLLGGRDNYREDRDAADLLEQLVPQIRLGARANRELLARVVRHYATEGHDQFIDAGSGLPTAGNVHQIADAARPGARTVYIDRDPVVVAHARALLWRHEHARIVHADLRDVDEIMTSPEITELLDLTRPVVLLFLAVLHFMPDEAGPAGLLADYASRLPAGSVIAVSHATTPADLRDVHRRLRPETVGVEARVPSAAATAAREPGEVDVRQAVQLYRDLVGPLTPRDDAQVADLFGALRLDPPGVMPGELWNDPEREPGRVPTAPILVATARTS